MAGTSAYGIPPSWLDELTRFHEDNEKSLLLMDDETKTRAHDQHDDEHRSGGADDEKMKGVKKEVVNRSRGRGGRGRARTQQVECSASFIEGQIAQLGYAGIGSLSNRRDSSAASEVSRNAHQIHDVSLAMEGVSLKSEEKCPDVEPIKLRRVRGRGRRIQKD